MLYLIAGNGAPNFGDELLVQHWLQFYRESGYAGPIIVDGKGGEPTAQLLQGFTGVEFLHTNIPRHKEGLDVSYAEFFEEGVKFARNNVARFKGVQAFHFLGGGYTGAHWKNVLRLLGGVTELGSLLNVPVFATGIGIEPFLDANEADLRAWDTVIQRFSILECRDEASFRRLLSISKGTAYNISFGLDDSFLYPVRTTQHSGRWLHLSGFSSSAVVGKSGIDGLKALAEDFDKILFWICAKADRKVFDDLQGQIPAIERISNRSLLNDGLPLNAGDFMITGRFHPHLLAARVGLSGYFYSGSDFYRNKHDLVQLLGSPFQHLPTAEPKVFEGSSEPMLLGEKGRIEEKRRLAERIAYFLGIKQ